MEKRKCEDMVGFKELIMEQDLDNIRRRISEHAELATSTIKSDAPIFFAARHNKVRVVEWLVREGHASVTNLKDNQAGATPLFIAAQEGHLETVQWLAREGPDLLVLIDDEGRTPLTAAATFGHLSVVQWLLRECGAANDVNSGWTALHGACCCGHLEIVKCLVQAGADVENVTTGSATPLFLAAESGHLNVVQWLVKEKNAALAKELDKRSNALIGASMNGHVEIVEWLICEANALVDYPSMGGWTALMFATQSKHLAVVKCLIEARAKVDLVNKNGCSSLILAAISGSLEITQILAHECPKALNQNSKKWTALSLAASKGHFDIVHWLVEEAKALLEPPQAFSALIGAAWGNHLDIAKWLISKHQLDFRHMVKLGSAYTALSTAARRGHLDFVRWFILEGLVTPDEKLSCGSSTLAAAAHSGHLQLVTFLLDHHVKGPKDHQGALHTACRYGHLEVAALLLERGYVAVDHMFRDMDCLQVAVTNGQLEVVQWLVQTAHAPINLKNGPSRLTAAAEFGSPVLIKLLVQFGARLGGSPTEFTSALEQGVLMEALDQARMRQITGALKPFGLDIVLALIGRYANVIWVEAQWFLGPLGMPPP